MKIYCPKWDLMIDNKDCEKCKHYTLTDHLQGNIYGYECSYNKEDK